MFRPSSAIIKEFQLLKKKVYKDAILLVSTNHLSALKYTMFQKLET
jgi:hypothetical protein